MGADRSGEGADLVRQRQDEETNRRAIRLELFGAKAQATRRSTERHQSLHLNVVIKKEETLFFFLLTM